MATATKPRVNKKLAEAANGPGPIGGLAKDVTVELQCTCGRKYWVFKENQADHPLCGFCEDRERELNGSPSAEKLFPPAVAELMSEGENPAANLAASAAGLQRLALTRIARNRFNPRQEFPDEEIAELAESLKASGQLQPVVVRRVSAHVVLEAIAGEGDVADFEIVAGERRALAAASLGWAEIDVIVRECDDAAAAKLAIEENRQRRDISQIEFARGVKRRMELAGLDVAGVAEDLKLDVSTVRNLFRLLEAPEAWQRRVISREISGTHLRHALPYLHAPAIEAALAKRVDEAVKEEGRLSESEKKWQRTIEDVVRAKAQGLSRFVHTNEGYQSTELKIDKKHPRFAELDVVYLEGWNGKKPFALNTKLANQLLTEKAKAWKAKHAASEKGGKAGKKGEPTPAERKKQAAAAKAEREEALQSLVYDWRRWLCSRAVVGTPIAEDIVFVSAIDEGICSGRSWQAGNVAGRTLTGKKTEDVGAAWLKATAAERRRAVDVFARESFWSTEEEYPSKRWDVERGQAELLLWCAQLGIDLAAAWRAKNEDGTQAMCGPLTERFFDLLTKAELEELAVEWKVATGANDSQADLVKKLRHRPERVLPLPRMLADVAGKTKQRKAK